MKQKNIKYETKHAILSTLINLLIRIVILSLFGVNYRSFTNATLLDTLVLITMMGLSIQTLFLPYLTWIRIKEIRKGEIYEASKY